jgi:hypothetical protein
MGETRFWKGVLQEVPDELARTILKKTAVKFEEADTDQHGKGGSEVRSKAKKEQTGSTG